MFTKLLKIAFQLECRFGMPVLAATPMNYVVVECAPLFAGTWTWFDGLETLDDGGCLADSQCRRVLFGVRLACRGVG